MPGVLENEKAILYWDQNLATNTKLAHNRPDITVFDKIANRTVLIEVSVAWYTRIVEAEEFKYSRDAVNSERTQDSEWGQVVHPGPNLATELQKDWKCRVSVVPVIIGACGEISKNLPDFLQWIVPNSTDTLIERLSRSAVLGTNQIIKVHLAHS